SCPPVLRDDMADIGLSVTSSARGGRMLKRRHARIHYKSRRYLKLMDEGNAGAKSCFTCGKPMIRAGQCPRWPTGEQLIEELIRKRLRDTGSPTTAMWAAF